MTKHDDSLFSNAVKCALDVNYSKVTSLSSGSLRNDDGDDYENVTQKVNLRCLKLSRAYSISFNSSNVGKFFLELNSKGLHQSSGKEKKKFLFLFPSSTKREIRQFHVIVVQRRQRNVQKSVAQLQSWCFACLNLLLFCHSRYRRRCHYVNSLLKYSTNLIRSFFSARKNTGANHTPFSGISLTLRSDTVSERKLWLAIKQWMKLQWKMYNINIFIQDSKSESDWNVSVNLDFYVLFVFFVCSF